MAEKNASEEQNGLDESAIKGAMPPDGTAWATEFQNGGKGTEEREPWAGQYQRRTTGPSDSSDTDSEEDRRKKEEETR